MEKTKSERKAVDWETVEKHFRAGLLSLREIAKEAGITEGAIRKRAKADQWSRNLGAKIKQRAEDLVRKAEVRKPSTQLTETTEKEVVEANAQAAASVLMSHKTDIGRTKKLFQALLGELEVSTTAEGRSLMDDLIEVMTEPEDPEDAEAARDGRQRAQKMRETLNKVLGISGRIDSAKRLTEILERLISMERVAFGIDEAEKQGSNVDALLKRVNEQG